MRVTRAHITSARDSVFGCPRTRPRFGDGRASKQRKAGVRSQRGCRARSERRPGESAPSQDAEKAETARGSTIRPGKVKMRHRRHISRKGSPDHL
ncbi:hypothetical protein BHM03_00011068 [Ensete ventricosum]|uniref:Uncharacterized protein n=1 Tax=Ensete ventricosum TaxID=4639 RepID=A0A427BB73_ENSVE|nr:hypothetical protein B296_00004875 [Ensete ventricosum]RZR84289.1 hypothetical protein BHM03_00011068 [Ensete ventricosum]